MELPTGIGVPKEMEIKSCSDAERAVGFRLSSRTRSFNVAAPHIVSSAALSRNQFHNRAFDGFARRIIHHAAAHPGRFPGVMRNWDGNASSENNRAGDRKEKSN